MTRGIRIGLAAAVAVIVVGGLAFTLLRTDETGPPRLELSDTDAPEWHFVIPAGTGELIDAGEDPEILPSELDARVGESVRIENQDSRSHMLGPWYVGSGETMTQRFATAGVFEGACSVDPDGILRLVVRSA